MHTIGRPPKGHRPWMSEKTWLLIQERVSLKPKFNDAQTYEAERDLDCLYSAKQKEAKKSIRRDKRNHAEAVAKEAEVVASRGDYRTVYKISKELCGKGLATEHPVKDADGHLIHGDQEQLLRWKNHFVSVLNNFLHDFPTDESLILPQMPSLRVRADAPTLREIKDVIKTLPNNNSAGVDGIPAEFFKA